jgi:hypothetical protein
MFNCLPSQQRIPKHDKVKIYFVEGLCKLIVNLDEINTKTVYLRFFWFSAQLNQKRRRKTGSSPSKHQPYIEIYKLLKRILWFWY